MGVSGKNPARFKIIPKSPPKPTRWPSSPEQSVFPPPLVELDQVSSQPTSEAMPHTHSCVF